MDLFKVEIGEGELQALSNLALAHVGDAVYELMCRTYLALEGRETNRSLHSATVAMVSANAQAAYAERLLPRLTPEEREIFRRGRNAKVNSVPHTSTYGQYHAATALEALFGYLYLMGRLERLNELFFAMVNDDGA